MHGVCKCFLFMMVGDIMTGSSSRQSNVGVLLVRYFRRFGVCVLCCLVLGLSGVPFLGLFFSKHFFFSILACGNPIMVGLLYCCVFLTCCYSFRLLFVLFMGCRGIAAGNPRGFIYIYLASTLGLLGGLFFCSLLLEDASLGRLGSCVILVLLLFGAIVGYWFSSGGVFFWRSLLWGGDVLVAWLWKGFSGVFKLFCVSAFRWEFFFLDRFLIEGFGLRDVFYGGLVNLILLLFLVFFFFMGVWGLFFYNSSKNFMLLFQSEVLVFLAIIVVVIECGGYF